jgi:predicted O-methyltransferase YrrM
MPYLKLLEVFFRDGRCVEPDTVLLYEYAMALSHRGYVVEIGSECGASLAVLASAVRTAGYGLPVISIDWMNRGREPFPHYPWEYGPHRSYVLQQNIMLLGLEDHVAYIHQQSLRVADFLGLDIALLHVDGEHGETGAGRDLDDYSPMVIPGGIIAVHDIKTDPGVVMNIQQFLAKSNDFVHVKDENNTSFLQRV